MGAMEATNDDIHSEAPSCNMPSAPDANDAQWILQLSAGARPMEWCDGTTAARHRPLRLKKDNMQGWIQDFLEVIAG